MNNPFFRPKKKELAPNSSDCSGQVVLIPTDRIFPNPAQPRNRFDEVDIVALADSIRQHGLIQPISVRRSTKSSFPNEKYYVVAGERRLRAFKMLGKEEIPCLLVDTSPLQSAELAIIENIMRKDLNLFEYASALETLIEKYELTQEELAAKMSTSQSNIANKLRLLRFTREEQQLILEKKLTERHARSLLRIADPAVRFRVAQYIADQGFNVKKTDEYIDHLLIPPKKSEKKAKPYDAEAVCHTFSKALAFVSKKGIQAQSERIESDSEIRLIIHIPKALSH